MTMMMMVMMIISKVMDDNHEEGRDLAEHHTPRPTCTSPISTPGQRNSSKMMEIVTSFELAWISSKTEVKMAMSRFNSITLPNNIYPAKRARVILLKLKNMTYLCFSSSNQYLWAIAMQAVSTCGASTQNYFLIAHILGFFVIIATNFNILRKNEIIFEREKMRKSREWISLHFLILSPFPLHFLILSPFSRSQAASSYADLLLWHVKSYIIRKLYYFFRKLRSNIGSIKRFFYYQSKYS